MAVIDGIEFVATDRPHVLTAKLDTKRFREQLDKFLSLREQQAHRESLDTGPFDEGPTHFYLGAGPIPRLSTEDDFQQIFKETLVLVVELSRLPPQAQTIVKEEYEDKLGDVGVIVWHGPLPPLAPTEPMVVSSPDAGSAASPEAIDAFLHPPYSLDDSQQEEWLRQVNRSDPTDESE